MAELIKIVAYNVKTKERNVELHDIVLTKTAKGAIMAKGVAQDGSKLVTLLGEAKAREAVAAGIARTEGFSFDETPSTEPTKEGEPA